MHIGVVKREATALDAAGEGHPPGPGPPHRGEKLKHSSRKLEVAVRGKVGGTRAQSEGGVQRTRSPGARVSAASLPNSLRQKNFGRRHVVGLRGGIQEGDVSIIKGAAGQVQDGSEHIEVLRLHVWERCEREGERCSAWWLAATSRVAAMAAAPPPPLLSPAHPRTHRTGSYQRLPCPARDEERGG